MVDLQLLIEEAPLAFLDFETTGLDPARGDRVIEIGLVRARGDTIEVEWDQLVNPERAVSFGAYRVNHISDAMLADAPAFAEIADELLGLINGTVVVAHNALFDLGFLKSELTLSQRPFPSLVVLDTLRLARNNITSGSYSLGALCQQFGIILDDAHRALADVRATRELFLHICRRLERRGVRTLEECIRAQGGVLKERGEASVAIPGPIRDALRRRSLMRIRYRDSYGSTTERLIRPIELSNRFGQLYLVAHCYLRRSKRTFALDRIQEMIVTDEPEPEEM